MGSNLYNDAADKGSFSARSLFLTTFTAETRQGTGITAQLDQPGP